MNLHKDLVISDKIKLTKSDLIERLNSKEPFLHTYLIVVPLRNTENQVEYFHIEICRQELFDLEDYIIIGVAFGKVDASELVVKIINHIYQETGSTDIRNYYLNEY